MLVYSIFFLIISQNVFLCGLGGLITALGIFSSLCVIISFGFLIVLIVDYFGDIDRTKESTSMNLTPMKFTLYLLQLYIIFTFITSSIFFFKMENEDDITHNLIISGFGFSFILFLISIPYLPFEKLNCSKEIVDEKKYIIQV